MSEPRQILLGLGSNRDALANIRRCLAALEARFGAIQVSPVYQSEDIQSIDIESTGANRPDAGSASVFHNMAVALFSDAAPTEIKAWCMAQERAQGRLPKSAGATTHPIDIDLLAVGELCGEFTGPGGRAFALPHPDITAYAFVLRPLAELVPRAHHPRIGETYAELWASARATASPRLTAICLPSSAPL
ncbi:2-amino-4-hydroxy-6-hydroxymethyldihydropteridine diphosphokinase [Vreelandella jeotgali]|uniref:2-amino-4-hydroxy-6- hydroxymethyldihydropteridine diphosphokinase n=1 Tax=Vreelandella jeotgali TaxID=553386 RepID=UPI00037CE546|nr:2-amino-4-hydroxy-6-hydroxymethyldihydropteridine diphosphokinase [Halomonas jeotgali]